jgi:hypothetical protein
LEDGTTAKVLLRDSTPLAIAARHAVSHEQRRVKAAAASALAIAKVQLELDRDVEARECRAFAREEARTRRIGYFTAASYLCGDGEAAPLRGLVTSYAPSASSNVSPAPLDTGVAAVSVSQGPQEATRKRSVRANDDAQRANAIKQNARRSAILKAKTAAKRNASATQPVILGTRAMVGAKVDAVAANDTRIVGAVADWWDRKRKIADCPEGNEVERRRLFSKTRVAEAPGYSDWLGAVSA